MANCQLLPSQLFFLPALRKQKILQESLGRLLSTVRKLVTLRRWLHLVAVCWRQVEALLR